MCSAVTTQDFRRLYEVQRIVQACLPDDERGQVVLPGWMRAYAAAAWQDRFFAEQNFTPLQQARPASLGQSQALSAGMMNAKATECLSAGSLFKCHWQLWQVCFTWPNCSSLPHSLSMQSHRLHSFPFCSL